MRRSSIIPYKADAPLVIDPDRVLPQTIRSKCFKTIAGRNAKISQRPDQINSASESAKPWIMADYNATRYGLQSRGMSGSLVIARI